MAFEAGSAIDSAARAATTPVDTKPAIALPPGYQWIQISAVLNPSYITNSRRKAFKGTRDVLLDMTARRYNMQAYDLWGYELHHRLPICLSPYLNGRELQPYQANAASNIDPVLPDDHDFMHEKIIDPQLVDLKPGQPVTLWLPRRAVRPKAIGVRQPGFKLPKNALGEAGI